MGNALAALAIGVSIGMTVKERNRWHENIVPLVVVNDNETFVPLDPLPPLDYLVDKHVTSQFRLRAVRCADNALGTFTVSRNALLFPVPMDLSAQRRALTAAVSRAKRVDAHYAALVESKLESL